jgi:Cu+-exporting ATPase
VSWDGVSRAVLTLRDRVKPTSAAAVSELEDLGLTPVLVSGDTNTAAQSVGRAVGIDGVIAGVLPHEKAELVADLQRQGEVVAMVGDGVNDAPALAEADLGIALASRADIAMEASDITLLTSDLRAVVDALRLSRRVLSTIKMNLVWAFAYNVAAIPLAVSGLLSPVVAAAAMAASSLLVVGNSLRLKRFRSIRVSNAEQHAGPPASSQASMKGSVS